MEHVIQLRIIGIDKSNSTSSPKRLSSLRLAMRFSFLDEYLFILLWIWRQFARNQKHRYNDIAFSVQRLLLKKSISSGGRRIESLLALAGQ
jgi:hypothetical protein